jgi:hypothetical protein
MDAADTILQYVNIELGPKSWIGGRGAANEPSREHTPCKNNKHCVPQ